MKHNSHQFHCGLKDGIPIGLGYLAVSFTFGIMARGAGLTTLQSVVMSFTNLTSAGQFAALGIIQAGAPFMEMAIAQLIINLRYCLMSCSLSQKLGADLSALNVALYGMFLAVVIPPAKTSRILTGVILASMALSLVFAHVPLLSGLSSGFKIILLTILIAGAAAILFPVKEENEHES